MGESLQSNEYPAKHSIREGHIHGAQGVSLAAKDIWKVVGHGEEEYEEAASYQLSDLLVEVLLADLPLLHLGEATPVDQ